MVRRQLHRLVAVPYWPVAERCAVTRGPAAMPGVVPRWSRPGEMAVPTRFPAVAAAVASECCLGRAGSMAEGSLAPATAAMAECRGHSGNTEAAVAWTMADRASRAAGAAGCQRTIQTNPRMDSIGPVKVPWRAVPVARRPQTKH